MTRNGRMKHPYRSEYKRLLQELASPPDDWHTFGSHIDCYNSPLEWWGDDGGGIPIWERHKYAADVGNCPICFERGTR